MHAIEFVDKDPARSFVAHKVVPFQRRRIKAWNFERESSTDSDWIDSDCWWTDWLNGWFVAELIDSQPKEWK